MKLEGKECLSENLNLTHTGDLCGRCLSFISEFKKPRRRRRGQRRLKSELSYILRGVSF